MSVFVPLDDLITPLTVAEIRTSVYSVLAAVGVTTTNWKPGAVVRTIITALAIVCAGLSALISLIARSGFLDTAVGSWLTLVAHYVYGVERIPATFATGVVRFTNAGGGVYGPLAPGDLSVSRTDPNTGITYSFVNTSTVTIPALSFLDVDVAATEQGAAPSALPGEIDTMVTVLSAVTCSNAAVVQGFDAEEDPALRTRCRERLGALSPNGPADAYRFVAKSVTRADGSAIGATRVRVVKDLIGGVDVYVATTAGGIAGAVGDLSTDLGLIDDAIQKQCVPLAITARVHSANVVVIPITYSFWLYGNSGLTIAQVDATVQAELDAFMIKRPIGGDVVGVAQGYVFKEALEATILRSRTSDGTLLPGIKCAVLIPNADVALAPNDVPVLGTIIGTVVPVTQGVI